MRELHILGGGFAGVWAAMSAAAERDTYDARDVRIRLFSNSPSLTIRPRLYEGASPDLRVPLAPLMKEIGVDFSVAEASNIVPQTRTIHFADGSDSRYDRLVLATGSRLRPLPIPGADIHAFSIDTFEEASRLDRHLEQLPPGDEASATVVIIGASFTGLELATELRSRLGKETRIILVDRMTKIGADLGANPEPHIEEAIKTCDIETRLETGGEAIRADALELDSGEVIKTYTVVLATGMTSSPLTRFIPGEYDEYGRLKVGRDLRVIGSEAVFAAGDTAHALADDIHPTYLSCQHALELGRYAGHNALHDLVGCELIPYRQAFYATCVDLGPWGALFTTGWDREVRKTRHEGKAMKQQINNEWIYPPSPAIGKVEIFRHIALSAEIDT